MSQTSGKEKNPIFFIGVDKGYNQSTVLLKQVTAAIWIQNALTLGDCLSKFRQINHEYVIM